MISSYPFVTSTPYELLVAQGAVPGAKTVTVFGLNSDVDTTEVSVWPLPSIIAVPAAALQMKVSSTSANDTAAGTGARTVILNGLDSSYAEITETVTLNGTTAVTTTNSFLRINSAYVATAGSTASAAGDIYIGTGVVTAGVPATVYNIIKYNYNTTITGKYTVPAGYTAYMTKGLFTAGQAVGTTSVTGKLITTGTDGIRRTAAVTTINNGFVGYDFNYLIPILEKTDVEATAIGAANNNSVSSMFIFVLVRNT